MAESKEAASARKKEDLTAATINNCVSILRLKKRDRSKVVLNEYKKMAAFSERILKNASMGQKRVCGIKPFQENDLGETEDE